MSRKMIILLISISLLLVATQNLYPLSLNEAMIRLRIEVLKAQMNQISPEDNIEKARSILRSMVELDEKIRALGGGRADVYMEVREQQEAKECPGKEYGECMKNPAPEPIAETSDNILVRYEKVVLNVCTKMGFDPAVIWTLLAIESNFSEDPVVIQKQTKCLGPWQHQPEHYIHYRKPDGTPYNPFDIYDACEVTVKILKDNLAASGTLEKGIRMYASGYRYVDTSYEQLPKAVKAYLDKFNHLYPKAKARFEKYGIYVTPPHNSPPENALCPGTAEQ